jgi:hypothetical protein
LPPGGRKFGHHERNVENRNILAPASNHNINYRPDHGNINYRLYHGVNYRLIITIARIIAGNQRVAGMGEGGRMQLLSLKPCDGDSWNDIDVFDEHSHRVVGSIRSKCSASPGFLISLYDRKYETTVSTYEECSGFIKGVEAVLKRLTSPDDEVWFNS